MDVEKGCVRSFHYLVTVGDGLSYRTLSWVVEYAWRCMTESHILALRLWTSPRSEHAITEILKGCFETKHLNERENVDQTRG